MKNLFYKFRNIFTNNTSNKDVINTDFSYSSVNLNSNIKVICILDEFSYMCFDYECILLPLHPESWKDTIDKEHPDILFVESFWSANNDTWKTPNETHKCELINIVNYCKFLNIPTVFWNKEDPYSFNTFISIARYFDIVFTTDINSIYKYKEVLDHARVYLLPFAAQPAIHNPIELDTTRRNKISFAGTYYNAKFEERKKDFEILGSIALDYGLDIYDRHFNSNKDQFLFPKKYASCIKPKLNGLDILTAYKGYKYSINVNSIKNSETMLARRVFELLSSNTIVLSSFSNATYNFFGDLVLYSDDELKLRSNLDLLNSDMNFYKKYRLLGLRSVLMNHTYLDRFNAILEKSLNIPIQSKWNAVAVIAICENADMLDNIIYLFKNQSYQNKKLYLFSTYTISLNEPSIYVYLLKKSKNLFFKDIVKEEYISIFHPDDYYGENYLLDLMCTTLYVPQCDAIGKNAYFSAFENDINYNNNTEYNFVSNLLYRNSIVKSNLISMFKVSSLYNELLNKKINNSNINFSIDSFNYIYNGTKFKNNDFLKLVSDIDTINSGKNITEIENIYFSRNISSDFKNIYKLDLSKFICSDDSNISLSFNTNDSLIINTQSIATNHQYINYMIKSQDFNKVPEYTPIDIDYKNEYLLSSFGSLSPNQSLSIVVISYSKNKKKDVQFIPINTSTSLIFDESIEKVLISLKVQGRGKASLDSITIKEKSSLFYQKSRSDYLVLTNNYPSYEKLYNNAFVHRRVKSYIKSNLDVEVFEFSYNNKNKFSSSFFDEVYVFRGYTNELRTLLKSSSYKKILIHFINLDMFDILYEFKNKLDIIVWFHGSDVSPWYRRYFEYENTLDLRNTVSSSCMRMSFIKKLFNSINDFRIHFVFVSDTLKKQVENDLGIYLCSSTSSIIHNPIDSELFSYKEKSIDDRKKILSIRPFSAKVYANDLSVLAILELSKKPYFNDLEFYFYGSGELFDDTVKYIKDFKNVHLYNKFLTQYEISKLHKDFGIFLIPTRSDTHGVSRDEAMSSGLVPITNNVGAIPEFVNENCAMLARENNYIEIAQAIEDLYLNPSLFLEKSFNASVHVRNICSYRNTVERELNLINSINSNLKFDTFNSSLDLLPKISIVMVSYNVEKYIDVAINSIINQSIGFKNLELILVDDFSSDKTREIITTYCNKYPQIKAKFNSNRIKFPGNNKNIGLNLASSEFVMFLDSDDIMDEHACNTLYNLITTYKSDYIIGKYSYKYDNSNRVIPYSLFDTDKYYRSYINFNLDSLSDNNLPYGEFSISDILKHPGTSCNKIFNKTFLSSNSIYFEENQTVGEDYIFNHRCLLKASKISYFPIEVFYYRMRNDFNNKSLSQDFTIDSMVSIMNQRKITCGLYSNTPYPFYNSTNIYFLVMVYNKLKTLNNLSNDSMFDLFNILKVNIHLFDINDSNLSKDAKLLFNYILNSDYSNALNLIR